MRLYKAIEEKLSKAFKILTAITLFFQMTIVFVGVVARYFFNHPLPWIDEMSTYLLIDITYLGGFVALRGGAMASITFIRDLLSGTMKKIVCAVSDLCIMALMLAVTVYGFKICSMPTVLNQKTPTLQLPIIIFYIVIPISGLLMLMCMLSRLIDDVRGKDTTSHEEGAFVE